jgi:hypothetical protein
MGPAAGTLEKDGNLVSGLISGPFSGRDIVVVVNEGDGRHERFSQWTAQLGTQDCILKPIRQGQTVTLN